MMFGVRIYRFVATFSPPMWGTFPLFSVEPKCGRNPREVQQKSSNLYPILLLQIIVNKSNLSLAVILTYSGEYFLPLAKVKLKALAKKGFSGQSCFDSPDVGDVERLYLTYFDLVTMLVASTLPMSPFEDKWEVLRLLEKLKGAED